MAVLVDVTDVAGVEPAALQHARRLVVVAPIAVHDQLAAHQDLAVAGDADLDAFQRRADGVHLVAA